MKILAIDTCTEVASVTLFSSEVKITRVLTDIPKSSGHILKLCDKVFKEVREDLKNIDLISYTNGPGAFTGGIASRSGLGQWRGETRLFGYDRDDW